MKTKSRIKDWDIFVSKRLKALRKGMDLTQEDLGDFLGVSFQQIQKYETGKNRLSAGNLVKILKQYKIPLKIFMDEEIDEKTLFLTKKIKQLDEKNKKIVDDLIRSLKNNK